MEFPACSGALQTAGDFLERKRAPDDCKCVVTNSPSKLAAQFAEHALTLVPDVFLLLRLAFLESVSRTDLLEHSGLRRVLVFRKRLPRMHRAGWDGPKASSSMAFAWMCWSQLRRPHHSEPQLTEDRHGKVLTAPG